MALRWVNGRLEAVSWSAEFVRVHKDATPTDDRILDDVADSADSSPAVQLQVWRRHVLVYRHQPWWNVLLYLPDGQAPTMDHLAAVAALPAA